MPVFICQSCGSEHKDWGGSCPNCGGSETIRLQAQGQDPFVGRTIKGKYKIVKRLGQGGMGAVYLAEQLGIGLKVALKFLKSEFSSDPEIARRFLNEAKSYALVAHPNAVTLHEFGQDEQGNLYLAMEYVEGVDLKKELAEKKRLPAYEALSIVLQATDILGHAHSRGVVHRDLKPENVMLRRGARGIHIKIMDFGIARLMNEGTKLTVAGSIAGTPRYMSPEQVEGREVDHRADIYSLGVVLYESLTGVQPFDGTSISEILRKQVIQPLPTLADHAPDLDLPPIDNVLQMACAKDPDARFQSMAAFAEALEQYQVTQQVRMPTGTGTGIPPPGDRATDVHREGLGETTGMQRGSDLGTVAGGQSLLNKSLDGRRPIELTEVAPARSHTPMIAAGVVVALLAAGGSYFAFTGNNNARATTGQPAPPPPQPVPTAVPPPVVQPTGGEQLVPMKVVISELELAKSKASFGRGTTEFVNGNIQEARNYFVEIPAGAPDHAQAQAQIKVIDEITATTSRAQSLRSGGRCVEAIPLYRKAIGLNGKFKDATSGLAACEFSKPPPTME